MKITTLPIFLTFLVMGIADAMGPMSDAVKNQYQLSNVISTLLPFFVFISFAVFSVPGGFFAARIGKKNLLLLGLGLNIIATGIPTFIDPGFILLLICIFILGVGTTFLQVAGNPIMRDVSPEGSYSKNLALAQGIKGLGSSGSTYLVGLVMVLAVFSQMGWRGAFPIFFVLMLIAFLFVLSAKIEEKKEDVPPTIGSSIALLKKPVFAFAVLGIFLYVGAEVCMGRFLKPTLQEFGFAPDDAALLGPTIFFGAITIGRLIGGILKINAHTLFRISSVLGILGIILVIADIKALSIAGSLISGFGFANIWPMLFSITVEKQPERSSELSGLMCMAICGGAIVPLIMGNFMDNGWASLSFIVPGICFLYLLFLSMKGQKKVAAV